MRLASSQLGWVLAALNVVVFAAMLAMRAPEYEQLRLSDEKLWQTGSLESTTADPMHLAGRPFYSSAHVADVPLLEDLYFVLNTPAMLAALALGYPLGSMTHEWWTDSVQTPSAWTSWALASVFALCGAGWAFAVGATIDWWREQQTPRG
jgi:hypothetical protein